MRFPLIIILLIPTLYCCTLHTFDNNGDCQFCFTSLNNCKECSNLNSCSECLTGTYASDDGKTCLPCQDRWGGGCEICTINGCSRCKQGYGAHKSGFCFPCKSETEMEKKCSVCLWQSGYSCLLTQAGFGVVDGGVAECTGSTCCSQPYISKSGCFCNDDFGHLKSDSMKCAAITTMDHCNEYELDGNNTTCKKCDYGWYLNGNNVCTACTDNNCLLCANDTCSKCKLNYHLNGSQACVTCGNNCKACQIDNLFQTVEQCFECEDGYYSDYSIGCVQCSIDNCQKCNSATLCGICNIGYFMKDGSCEKCPAQCPHCFEPTKCSECGPGLLLTTGFTCVTSGESPDVFITIGDNSPPDVDGESFANKMTATVLLLSLLIL